MTWQGPKLTPEQIEIRDLKACLRDAENSLMRVNSRLVSALDEVKIARVHVLLVQKGLKVHELMPEVIGNICPKCGKLGYHYEKFCICTDITSQEESDE